MNVDIQNFQPLAMFNQFAKGMLKIDNGSITHNNNHIDKQNRAANIVNNKLNEALGIPTQFCSNNSNQFDFESVANNIPGFVSNAINEAKDNGATRDKLEKMLFDAKIGINKGFSEASKLLQKLGLFNDEVEEGIDKASEQLIDGLQNFTRNLFKSSDSASTAVSSYREAMFYSLSKDASYSIATKEGDEINITFNSNYRQQSSSSDYSSYQQSTFQGAFSFEINGDLNEHEQQAINELMGSLQNVSELFFTGDFDQAFDNALKISMDPTHLAAFSMDLQRTETIVSIKEYQQFMPGKELAEQFIPLNNELMKSYEKAKPFMIEEHLTDLLAWLMTDKNESEDLLKYSQAVFDKLQNSDCS